MTNTKTVKIEDLLINPENYRYEPVGDEEAAIKNIVDDQGNKKLYSLALDIMTYNLNPTDQIIISPWQHDKTKYIVLEGNRRAVVLKFLVNPDRIRDNGLKKKFEDLKKQHQNKIITNVECIYYDDPKEADHWIALKHGLGNEGAGTEKWTSVQKNRYEQKNNGTPSIALQVLSFLESSPYISTDTKDKMKDVKLTNLDRLLSDPDIRNAIGINYSDGELKTEIDGKEIAKTLEKIVTDCIDPNFTVKTIYSKKDRQDYIKSLPKDALPDKSKTSEKLWALLQPTNNTGTVAKKIKVNPKNRQKLIPKTCNISIDNPKINSIYHELKKIPIENYVNATAALFRVFVELSIDHFCEKNEIPTEKTGKFISLKDKASAVAEMLEKQHKVNSYKLKGIRTAASEQYGVLGIKTWQAFLHNKDFAPTAQYLTTTWDNIQEFIEKLWEASNS
ncbi:MAG: hypothetical protein HY364_02815 [Candidatus Aenigmarchaeota archaeon]|nr:hypothetical protein [Candidatus Aenigmarchaeota archaeon]